MILNFIKARMQIVPLSETNQSFLGKGAGVVVMGAGVDVVVVVGGG